MVVCSLLGAPLRVEVHPSGFHHGDPPSQGDHVDLPTQDVLTLGGPSSWAGLFLGILGDLSYLEEEISRLVDLAIQKEVDVEDPSSDEERVVLL